MFTGIVERVGVIEAFERQQDGGRMRIRAAEGPELRRGAEGPDLRRGEVLAPSLAVSSSIAVNGCSLSGVEVRGLVFAADLSGETFARTTLGALPPGTRVNLERPLTAGQEFGGHFVQGHVDGIGRVTRMAPVGALESPTSWWLSVRVPDDLARYVAAKGSLAVDGISLSVAAWQDGVADFAIIPYSYTHTNLRDLAVGDAVNLECDILAKYVERLLQARSDPAPSRLNVARLLEEGF